MPAANYLPDVLETTEAERLATGFIFTEGPLWHPDGLLVFRRYPPEQAVPHDARARRPSSSGRPSAATARPSTCRAA